MAIFLLNWVPYLTFLAWLLCSSWLSGYRRYGYPVPDLARTIRREIHPFRWALAVLNFVGGTMAHGVSVGPGVGLALALLWCWVYRKDDDDDDRWKRRLDAATGYVREVAGRLTVVPEPA